MYEVVYATHCYGISGAVRASYKQALESILACWPKEEELMGDEVLSIEIHKNGKFLLSKPVGEAFPSEEPMKKTLLITHDGFAHADDLLCTAVLKGILPNCEVLRTRKAEDAHRAWQSGDYDSLVEYDVTLIGDGKFDHHTNDNVVVDGRKLSSIGKIWRHYKHAIMEKFCIDEISWKTIDENFIKPIDIMDNGGAINPYTYVLNSKMKAYCMYGCEYVFEAALKIITEDFSSILTVETDASLMRKEVEALPNYVVNGKCFKLADKLYSVGRELPFCDGILTKDGDIYKVLFVNGNTFTKKGVKANEIEGVIFTHPAGFCGNVTNLEVLKEIV